MVFCSLRNPSTYIILLTFHNKWTGVFSLIYRGGNRSPERLSDWCKVRWWITGESGTWTGVFGPWNQQYFYLMVTAFAGRLVSWGPEGEVEVWALRRDVCGWSSRRCWAGTGLVLVDHWAGRVLEAKSIVQPGAWPGIGNYFLSFYSGSGDVLCAQLPLTCCKHYF